MTTTTTTYRIVRAPAGPDGHGWDLLTNGERSGRYLTRALARKAKAELEAAQATPTFAEPQPAGRARTSGSSATDGPPPRCPGVGQKGLDGRFPGDTDRCPVCSQDHATVRRDGTVGSHKLLKARPGAEAAWNAAVAR
jgi:hypothetical protein